MIDILCYVEFAPVGIAIGNIQVMNENFLHVMFTMYNQKNYPVAGLLIPSTIFFVQFSIFPFLCSQNFVKICQIAHYSMITALLYYHVI